MDPSPRALAHGGPLWAPKPRADRCDLQQSHLPHLHVAGTGPGVCPAHAPPWVCEVRHRVLQPTVLAPHQHTPSHPAWPRSRHSTGSGGPPARWRTGLRRRCPGSPRTHPRLREQRWGLGCRRAGTEGQPRGPRHGVSGLSPGRAGFAWAKLGQVPRPTHLHMPSHRASVSSRVHSHTGSCPRCSCSARHSHRSRCGIRLYLWEAGQRWRGAAAGQAGAWG